MIEFPTVEMQPHITCKPGDVGKYVLLPGDPGRVPRIAKYLRDARKVAENREFVTCTGQVDNITVSITSTGIGCPSAAIAVEELHRIGAHTFIRVGTTGAYSEYIGLGDIIIATAAVRDEGTSRFYVPIEYPSVAHHEVINALIQAARRVKARYYVGVVHTIDAFYGRHPPEFKRTWRDANVLSVEMECSGVFIAAAIRGCRAGAVLAVDGNVFRGELLRREDPRFQEALDKAILTAIEAVKILHKTSNA
ncbi:MAG: Purine nucleoside phosphorylase [Candidatus Bathyarchaeota archaeon BA1]|nr:MAG: Purine nucleoside phosphorylase [Candidatus Bathyarchaeota archaeon BA1]